MGKGNKYTLKLEVCAESYVPIPVDIKIYHKKDAIMINTQAKPNSHMKWTEFHTTDKGSNIQLKGASAAHTVESRSKFTFLKELLIDTLSPIRRADYSPTRTVKTVRAARWSLPEGRASATIRVDR